MRSPWVRYIAVGVLWAVGLIALPLLPNPAPIHWNAAGEVDGYGSPLLAALLLPAIGTAVAIMTPLLPRIDPRGERYVAFGGTYALIMNAAILFFLVVQLVTVGFALGFPLDVSRLIGAGVGLLLAVIGNELGRVQPNFFVGIRTPWTLADPEVWRRTHRVGGRVFAGFGALIVLTSLLLPPPAFAPVVALGAVGLVLFVFAYSYWQWRRLTRGDGPRGI
jgi:uncharacterized membrane protein